MTGVVDVLTGLLTAAPKCTPASATITGRPAEVAKSCSAISTMTPTMVMTLTIRVCMAVMFTTLLRVVYCLLYQSSEFRYRPVEQADREYPVRFSP